MKKILVVDDDKKISKALAIRLKANGYEVHAAFDGLQAVSAARSFRPDLIVMDINMPAGGGLSAAERIGDLVETAGTPVIFITASKKDHHRIHARSLGATGFFEKPYDSEDLLSAIGDALDQAA